MIRWLKYSLYKTNELQGSLVSVEWFEGGWCYVHWSKTKVALAAKNDFRKNNESDY
ncbi:hypothetical protein GCM10028807_61960 [Spirosoma daeguense]